MHRVPRVITPTSMRVASRPQGALLPMRRDQCRSSQPPMALPVGKFLQVSLTIRAVAVSPLVRICKNAPSFSQRRKCSNVLRRLIYGLQSIIWD